MVTLKEFIANGFLLLLAHSLVMANGIVPFRLLKEFPFHAEDLFPKLIELVCRDKTPLSQEGKKFLKRFVDFFNS